MGVTFSDTSMTTPMDPSNSKRDAKFPCHVTKFPIFILSPVMSIMYPDGDDLSNSFIDPLDNFKMLGPQGNNRIGELYFVKIRTHSKICNRLSLHNNADGSVNLLRSADILNDVSDLWLISFRCHVYSLLLLSDEPIRFQVRRQKLPHTLNGMLMRFRP